MSIDHWLLLIAGFAIAGLLIDNHRLRKLIAPFDHDHDGRPGG